MLSRTKAVQNPTLSLDMVTTGNMYDGTATQTMTVGTIDNCLTHDAAQLPDPNTQHNHVVNLIVQNVEDIAGAQARFNHDDTKAEVTNLNWTPFSDPNTLSPVGFLNLPIDPTATDHRAVTQTSDFSQPGTSLSAASYLGTQDAAISPDTPAKPAPDGNTSYSAPSGGARTGTPRTSPAASPAALPPTGTSAGGGSSPWTYVLLLGAGMTASASGAFGLYRLRKR